MANDKITYKTDIHALLEQYAKMPTSTLEGMIQQFNLSVAEAEQREARRLEQRAEFIPGETERRFNAWLAGWRERFARQAGEAFDAAQPPLNVPARVELDEVAKAKAKKGRAA